MCELGKVTPFNAKHRHTVSNNYDFSTLSHDDFERLCADLLSAEMRIRFEQFKSGKDNGIDLRHANVKGDTKIIVQCKLYAGNGFSNLLSTMKNDELPKIEKLKPTRYIVATSTPLNPSEKDRLLEALKPWCISTQDIIGRHEINALIRKFPSIEQAHFKLWLASTPVLQAILNAGVWNFSAATLEEIKADVCRFVTHAGVGEAQKILNEHHHCLIVGVPGIGKTTLANILIYQHIKEGFKPVVVSADIREAWDTIEPMRNSQEKTIILYDDFLGQVSFESSKLEKNEDKRLITLLQHVKRSPHLRMILTTREYILAEAERSHSSLTAEAKNNRRFTLNLAHYNQAARAKILYNHLYFSNLPNSRLQAILKNEAHKIIVKHPNYNPRIIRAIAEHENFKHLNDEDFVRTILQNLNDPIEVWEQAFENHINSDSRKLTHIVWTFGTNAPLASLKSQFKAALGIQSEDELNKRFTRSLKELDGNFIRTTKIVNPVSQGPDAPFFVSFHNPSIRDYLASRLKATPRVLLDYTKSISTYEQAFHILQITLETKDAQIKVVNQELILLALRLCNESKYFLTSISTNAHLINETPDPATRIAYLLNLAHKLDSGTYKAVRDKANQFLLKRENIQKQITNRNTYSITNLLDAMSSTETEKSEELIKAIILFADCIAERACEITRFEQLVDLIEATEEFEPLSEQVRSIAIEQSVRSGIKVILDQLRDDDSPWEGLEDCTLAIDKIERALEIDLSDCAIEVEEIFTQKDIPDPEERNQFASPTQPDIAENFDLDSLFQTLDYRKDPPQ